MMNWLQRLIPLSVIAILGGRVHAVPEIPQGSVSVSQCSSRVVTINYTLANEDAIVTVDVLTNGVSIGDANLTYFTGDAFRRVSPGARTIQWLPLKAWPGHKITDRSVSYVLKAWSLDNPPDYLVADLTNPNTVNYYVSESQLPRGVSDDVYKTTKLVMRRIPAAHVRWRMGSPCSEESRKANETAHIVSLTDDYYIGIYELTQGQYAAIAGENPPTGRTGDDVHLCPVDAVPHKTLRGTQDVWPSDGHVITDAACWLYKLRQHTGVSFDLPTSAQWEFACRAGTGTALYTGADVSAEAENALYPIAWTQYTTDKIMPVGLKVPNAFGLYDMLGNVWEICLDQSSSGHNYYEDSEIDPCGPNPSPARTTHVRRGGGRGEKENYNRSACWHEMAYDDERTGYYTGFRLWAPLPQL